MEVQFCYLKQQVDWSIIYLILYEISLVGIVQCSFGSKIVMVFVDGWGLLKNLVFGVIMAWLVFLLLVLFIWWWCWCWLK